MDDGSTDGSAFVCDEWINKDPRIKVIHKENGGLSDARNVGMYHATGHLYSFIDGDDEISSEMLRRLYEELVGTSSDISMCRMEKIESTKRYPTRDFPFRDKCIEMTGKEATRLLLKDVVDCSACIKLYKREILESLRFPVGKTNEDFAVMYKALSSASRVVYISDILYYYYARENSITSTKFNEKQFDKLDNCLEMVDYISENIQEFELEAKGYLYRQAMYLLKTVCVNGLKREYKNRFMQLVDILRGGTFNILRSQLLSPKEKGMYLFIAWLPDLYAYQKRRKD